MKRLAGLFSCILLLFFIWYAFFSLMPQKWSKISAPSTEFSTERALLPLQEIAKAPHFHGSKDHTRVRNYIVAELEKLGLTTEVQEGFVLNKWKGLDHPKNIIGKLKGTGNGKSLLLLSHYDSAKVPSPGASDAGSGVVTILESLRAYLAAGKQPVNDIIVLFSDAEEIGLDGAKLFVNKHPLAKNVGLVLNFEARGSGGPSNMILETNGGNANMIKAFTAANPEYPVASSLMYSVYKMLPNDTDSTVFREEGDIDSFFFAFIDDHYDYHTANDTYENLDRTSLEHQGSYLMPLLDHFSSIDLTTLKATEDYVYVNVPFVSMISYPFAWIIPMLLLAFASFIGLLLYGFRKGTLYGKAIAKGFVAFLIPLLLCTIIGYLGWGLLKIIYPQYNDIQHGFTYNGHYYIGFFVLITTGISLSWYKRFKPQMYLASFYVAPLTIWLLINTVVAFVLEGAAFWIIPLYFGLLSFFMLLRQHNPGFMILTLLAAPAIFIFAPLIQFFPVGLGLKMVLISCLFVVLLFGLLLPLIARYRWKKILAAGAYIGAFICFIGAHATSDYNEQRNKPNSLLYYKNDDAQTSYWVTYDKKIDAWTKGYLGETPKKAADYITSAAGSKYNTGYTYAAVAPQKQIPPFKIRKELDTFFGNFRQTTFTIIPKREVHEISVYTDKASNFETLSFNGVAVPKDTASVFYNRKSDLLLRHYVSENDSLKISFTGVKDISPNFKVLEYSYNLLQHPQFTIHKRPSHTMPMPFVNTDAIVVQRSFNLDSLLLTFPKDTIPQGLLQN